MDLNGFNGSFFFVLYTSTGYLKKDKTQLSFLY